jgi:GntR family transcriptional regulator, vanillate catabolism transcriptional regulator
MAESLKDVAAAKLRTMILSGEIEPETHLQEAHVAELLGMSRTPVKAALIELANEGILAPGPWRGYKVRSFTMQEVGNAYAVRATLEGMVCRVLAENGVSDTKLREIREILEAGDELLDIKVFEEEHLRTWMAINHRFHTALANESGNDMLKRMIETSQSVPLVHPGFVGRYQYYPEFRDHLREGQSEHYRMVLAIERRQSARAEALMREHVIDAAEVWLSNLNASHTSDEARADLGSLGSMPVDLKSLAAE